MNDFINDGFTIIPQLFECIFLKNLQKAITEYTRKKSVCGIRDLHHKVLAIADLVNSQTILDTLKQYNNYQQFKIIKAIYFNKNLEHNWAVAWHQDKTIAVHKKTTIPEYKNWTVKQSIPHVQPPLNILEKITTVRVALDDTDSNNGALKVIPQSHKLGILTQPEIDRIVHQSKYKICSLKAGDVLIMHPLLLHSSSKSISTKNRRIIHLEYSSCNLPQGLNWHC